MAHMRRDTSSKTTIPSAGNSVVLTKNKINVIYRNYSEPLSAFSLASYYSLSFVPQSVSFLQILDYVWRNTCIFERIQVLFETVFFQVHI
jgi:hypothetical protein